MVFINEWLPNPVGPDASSEFVELYNRGESTTNLAGWILRTENGKKFLLNGDIAGGSYLVLKHAETKLSLRNASGGLALYNSTGMLLDRASFSGVSPEGKSFSRIDYGTADTQHFAFVLPTPGALNNTINNSIAFRHYPPNVSLSHRLETSGFFAIMMGTAILLTGFLIYIVRSHEDLSHLLFGTDKKARGEAR